MPGPRPVRGGGQGHPARERGAVPARFGPGRRRERDRGLRRRSPLVLRPDLRSTQGRERRRLAASPPVRGWFVVMTPPVAPIPPGLEAPGTAGAVFRPV